MPPLQQSPTELLLPQFVQLYERGKASLVPLSVASLTALSSVAWHRYSSPSPTLAATWPLFAAAGALTASIVPYTLLVMGSTNDTLIAGEKRARAQRPGSKADEVKLDGGQSAHDLLARWGLLNAIRATFPLSAGVIALWASLA